MNMDFAEAFAKSMNGELNLAMWCAEQEHLRGEFRFDDTQRRFWFVCDAAYLVKGGSGKSPRLLEN